MSKLYALPTHLNRVASAFVLNRRSPRPDIEFIPTIPVDPRQEIDRLPHTARCLVLEAMKEYVLRHKLREAGTIHVTPVLETLFRQEFVENGWKGMGTHEKPERCDIVMGMKPVWDAKKFKLSA